MIGTSVAHGSQACAEVAAFNGFSLLAFLVDTASELLPKGFGSQGLGQAKPTSTMNGPGNEFSMENAEKAKTIKKGKLSK